MKALTCLALIGWLACALAPPHVFAQAALPEGYALVVGSNAGGPGQATLRYAEEDAERVGDVMTSIGGFARDRVERLLQPTAAELRAAIERIRARAEPLARSGTQLRFFFYYSGHARADALNLGGEDMPLSELRERLLALPSTLSIVVLDACQSGAFSRVKGASRASDFSFNSVDRLNTEGMAVIASSSGKELSQESDSLQSGFFTHHWLVALRGGGDRDGDGRVTLSEAYQYAYNHTLANTAQTSVGEQHATLETNLRGKDDIALTHPAAANAHLRIPSTFEGRVLLQSLPSWSVLAELDKARGEPIMLAFPQGAYAASLRRGSDAVRCSVILRDGTVTELDPDQCVRIAQPPSNIKGSSREALAADSGKQEGWALELGFGLGSGIQDDAYIRRLREFNLHENGGEQLGRYELSVGRRLLPNLLIGLSFFSLAADEYAREIDTTQKFSWSGHAFGAFVQGDLPLGRRRLLSLFGRAGAGATYARTWFDAIQPETAFADQQASFQDTTTNTERIVQHFWRPCGWIAGGLDLTPSRFVGFQFQLRYVIAPAIANTLGETHDLGGLSFITSFRFRTWE